MFETLWYCGEAIPDYTIEDEILAIALDFYDHFHGGKDKLKPAIESYQLVGSMYVDPTHDNRAYLEAPKGPHEDTFGQNPRARMDCMILTATSLKFSPVADCQTLIS